MTKIVPALLISIVGACAVEAPPRSQPRTVPDLAVLELVAYPYRSEDLAAPARHTFDVTRESLDLLVAATRDGEPVRLDDLGGPASVMLHGAATSFDLGANVHVFEDRVTVMLDRQHHQVAPGSYTLEIGIAGATASVPVLFAAKGDVTSDGIFNSRDFVQMLQSGDYDAPRVSDVRLDVDGDGRFTSADMVLMLSETPYVEDDTPYATLGQREAPLPRRLPVRYQCDLVQKEQPMVFDHEPDNFKASFATLSVADGCPRLDDDYQPGADEANSDFSDPYPGDSVRIACPGYGKSSLDARYKRRAETALWCRWILEVEREGLVVADPKTSPKCDLRLDASGDGTLAVDIHGASAAPLGVGDAVSEGRTDLTVEFPQLDALPHGADSDLVHPGNAEATPAIQLAGFIGATAPSQAPDGLDWQCELGVALDPFPKAECYVIINGETVQHLSDLLRRSVQHAELSLTRDATGATREINHAAVELSISSKQGYVKRLGSLVIDGKHHLISRGDEGTLTPTPGSNEFPEAIPLLPGESTSSMTAAARIQMTPGSGTCVMGAREVSITNGRTYFQVYGTSHVEPCQKNGELDCAYSL